MTDREKFEVWLKEKCKVRDDSLLRVGPAKETYFHSRIRDRWEAWQAALASQQTADEGWIEWAGGQCPLRDRATVDVMWQDKTISRNCLAYFWDWDHAEGQENIIAYRVVKP